MRALERMGKTHAAEAALASRTRLQDAETEAAHSEDDPIVARVGEGARLALVSDAGTPGISDPGFTLVRRVYAARAEGEEVNVTMIPGVAGVVMAVEWPTEPTSEVLLRG